MHSTLMPLRKKSPVGFLGKPFPIIIEMNKFVDRKNIRFDELPQLEFNPPID